jgi:hypothetical protein
VAPPSQTEFVNQQNIRRYEQELTVTPASPRRTMLVLLLAEERAKGWPQPPRGSREQGG